jgi:hypothetical protein
MATEMDALVLEDCLLQKRQMKHGGNIEAREEYLAQFQLD